ncbi:MAG: 2,3,4,5-tetrahydropyridine-2,6-dicarboxylate N-succinyltransferase, partial [Candidatus Obscuribacterales bacterium]|nr:2,3,4,5-tetrahydropyridine-2,6-dicarboxylate N-succinyltransferase [Steroidobacteraceae bacterium]
MSQTDLAALITAAFERRTEFTPKNAPTDVRHAVEEALALLDSGKARVAEKIDGQWTVHQWLKKSVLLSFRLNDNQVMQAGGFTQFFDKVPSKYADY